MRDHKENMKKVGYRMGCAIKDAGSTQAEVANLLGVNSSTPSQWVNGYSYPSVANIIDFCDLIGCSMAYVMDGDESAKKSGINGISEMKRLHDEKAISDKIYYSFLEEKLEELR